MSGGIAGIVSRISELPSFATEGRDSFVVVVVSFKVALLLLVLSLMVVFLSVSFRLLPHIFRFSLLANRINKY